MIKAAELSPDERYRYTLTREWGPGPLALFVMLNPSTADAEFDDPTIRRCIGFARSWKLSGVIVVNLFALRATSPRALTEALDPYGPRNDVWIARMLRHRRVYEVVAAWGAHKLAAERAAQIELLRRRSLSCLGTTKSGAPRHPLYVRADQKPVPYVWPGREREHYRAEVFENLTSGLR